MNTINLADAKKAELSLVYTMKDGTKHIVSKGDKIVLLDHDENDNEVRRIGHVRELRTKAGEILVDTGLGWEVATFEIVEKIEK